MWHALLLFVLTSQMSLCLGAQLLIRQLAEGSSYNKALQLYNLGPNPVNLEKVQVLIASNGKPFRTVIPKLGSQGTELTAESSFTVMHPDADATWLEHANVTDASLEFNGDDAVAIALVHEAPEVELLDQVGAEKGGAGWTPSIGWAVAGIAGATKDHTLIRKWSVIHGARLPTWQASAGTGVTDSEWVVLGRDTFLPSTCPGSSSSSLEAAVLASCMVLAERPERLPSRPPYGHGAHVPPGGAAPHAGETPAGEAAHEVMDTGGGECPDAPTAPHDRRTNTSFLTIATFNAEWLFDGIAENARSPWRHGSTECSGYDAGINGCDEAGARAHAQRVAAVIQAVDADILNVVEVEGCGMLSSMTELLPNSSYRPYLIKGSDSFLGQNAGLLTRIDPVAALWRNEAHVAYPVAGSGCGYRAGAELHKTGVSKHYATRFELAGVSIVWIGAHLKAIPTQPKSCAQREGQAEVLQTMVMDALNQGAEVVVTGLKHRCLWVCPAGALRCDPRMPVVLRLYLPAAALCADVVARRTV
ncbi:hypothetical protein CYMTET_48348 [Cymbomonas tetramitiformis]|uniref:Uncharacterized protein n=1 Tax=Cymbomonas tetramitiformis TaxID=36881 RepID=A0AAE0EWV3_9CHLO|nr:hypothetical protein CYMTET_48348 [Cymbomonas tetramitiformis]